ncbi:MAG: hypothetical protein GY950_37295 [bacterium]|nr:hypothetical protein [bacterium]
MTGNDHPPGDEFQAVTGFLGSADFRVFLDETLLSRACQAVDYFLENHKGIKNSQLHAISPLIRSGGLKALMELIKNQKDKNSSETNKAFWNFVYRLVEPGADNPDFSLYRQISQQLAAERILEDTAQAADKKAAKTLKKNNKKKIDRVMDEVIPVYFEHFTCHYFYKNKPKTKEN